MQRSAFIAAIAAVAVMPTFPQAAPAAIVQPAAYSVAYRLFVIEDGTAWVRARSAAEAIAEARRYDFEFADDAQVHEMAPDDEFTLLFDSKTPKDLEPDFECVCTSTELERYLGCVCEAAIASVTMTAAEWADHLQFRSCSVIGVFEG